MSTTAQKPREEWVDIARCLAMAVIMSLHAGGSPALLGVPVGGAICLFFVLAGYFMPREAGRAAVRALRLGLAWLLWSLISLGLYIAAQPGVEWSWAGAFGIGCSAYNAPLWFLRDLCVFQLLVAGLAALRVLPRYNWPAFALLLGCTYAAEPAQHEALRFSWLPAMLLGYALRGTATLQQLRGALSQHGALLLTCGALLLLQRYYYPQLLQHLGLRGAECSLPVGAVVWAAWYALAAVAILRLAPRVGACIARAGACMLFIYAAHSPAYAPFYHWQVPPVYGSAIMLLLMAVLAALATRLQRLCPGLMRLLSAK